MCCYQSIDLTIVVQRNTRVCTRPSHQTVRLTGNFSGPLEIFMVTDGVGLVYNIRDSRWFVVLQKFRGVQ